MAKLAIIFSWWKFQPIRYFKDKLEGRWTFHNGPFFARLWYYHYWQYHYCYFWHTDITRITTITGINVIGQCSCYWATDIITITDITNITCITTIIDITNITDITTSTDITDITDIILLPLLTLLTLLALLHYLLYYHYWHYLTVRLLAYTTIPGHWDLFGGSQKLLLENRM